MEQLARQVGIPAHTWDQWIGGTSMASRICMTALCFSTTMTQPRRSIAGLERSTEPAGSAIRSIWAEDYVSTRRGAHEEDIVRRMELRLSRSQVCNAHESRIRKVAIRFLQQFDLSAWIRAPPKKNKS